MIEISKRSFIAALGALVAAPAVVSAKIDAAPRYYHRVIAAYDIGSDTIKIRVEKARHPLPMPKYGINIPAKMQKCLIARHDAQLGDVPEGEQRSILSDWHLTGWPCIA